MISRKAEPLFRRDVVLFCSQSNGGHPINLLSTWPQREQIDASSQWATYWDLAGAFGDVRANPLNTEYGCLVNSLCARMRDRGMLPAVSHVSWSGTHSDAWYAARVAVGAWHAARLATLSEANVRALLWYQGETDAMDGPGDTWQANVAAVIASIRSAVSLPELPLIVVKIPANHTPSGSFGYLSQVRAGIDALVAADGNAVSVEPVLPTYADTGTHLDQPSLAALARQIVAQL